MAKQILSAIKKARKEKEGLKNLTAKKTTTKKSAAPAPPKPKLIDGKYSHVFLLRLFPDAGDKMEKIMKAHNQSTQTGAVALCVQSYQEHLDKIREQADQINNLFQEKWKMETMISEFKRTFSVLMSDEPVKVEKQKGSWECADCFDEYDYSEKQPHIHKGDKLCDSCYKYLKG